MNNPSNNPNPGLTKMHSMWNAFTRHYIEQYNGQIIGGIFANNEPHQFRVTQFDTPHTENMPTNRRVITEMSPKLTEPSDHTAIYYPGFSETSAQMEGDPAEIAFEMMRAGGHDNPKLLCLNPCGKGTREYVERTNLISRIGVLDEVRDVRVLVKILLDRGVIQGDVSLIAHSMGTLTAMASLDILEGRVKNMIQLMPCTDKSVGLTFSPRFLWTVRNHVKYSLDWKNPVPIDKESHDRIMFSVQKGKGSEESETEGEAEAHDHSDHHAGSVPDSSRRFFQVTLNKGRLPREVFKPEAAKGVKAHIMQAGHDALIPDSMVSNQVRYLKGLGMEIDAPFVAESFPHAIPMHMNARQRREFGEFLGGAFKK